MKKQILTAVTTAGIFFSVYSGSASASGNTYTVQSGDTLWKIAQSNHVSVQDIQSWNHLSSNTIFVGQKLSLESIPQVQQNSYTVKSGDSLSVIAKRNNISVLDLKKANQLTSDVITVGQVLKIPTTPLIKENPSSSSYVVKSGDSLSAIAKKNNTTIAELKSINHLSSDTIRIGQVLNLSNTTTIKSQNPSENNSDTTYTVISGDSLSLIAKKYGLTVAELKSINHLSSDVIRVGQVLQLTGVKAAETVKPTIQSFNADALINEAKKYIGVKYVWGGSTPSGFDCSGFLQYVYSKIGVQIPRTVATIWDDTKTVSTLEKGDILFFDTVSGPSHAGIYIGNNQFIHASTSQGVMISDLNNVYWKPRYLGAKRVY